VKIQLRQGQMKRVFIQEDSEFLQMAAKLGISMDSEAIRNIIAFGMKSTHSDTRLIQTVRELEERKQKLEEDFRKIAFQSIQLEARYVGTRNQVARVYRDNQVLAMHLCAYSPRTEHGRLARERLIQKYIMNAKLM